MKSESIESLNALHFEANRFQRTGKCNPTQGLLRGQFSQAVGLAETSLCHKPGSLHRTMTRVRETPCASKAVALLEFDRNLYKNTGLERSPTGASPCAH